MDPKAGMLRLVAGLGTRAVNRVENDYPRTVALDNPLYRPHAGPDEARRFSQHDLDVLNIDTNSLETISLSEKAHDGLNIKLDLFGVKDHETTQRMRSLGYHDREAWILTFDNLLSRSSLTGVMHRMLKKLEEIYDYPVETEFAVNFTESNTYRINLLQCRPVQTRGQSQRVSMPDHVDDNKLFICTEGHFMGGSVVQDISRVIVVDSSGYSGLTMSDKHSIARLIGKLNKLIKNRDETPTLLLGPGRWGTTTPSLGVPVRFSEINNVSFLGEVAYTDGNLMPELSFGTHFFQDLVETNIFYLALFPDKAEVTFNLTVLNRFENILETLVPESSKFRNIVRVYETKGHDLRIMADIVSQKLVCFFG